MDTSIVDRQDHKVLSYGQHQLLRELLCQKMKAENIFLIDTLSLPCVCFFFFHLVPFGYINNSSTYGTKEKHNMNIALVHDNRVI